MNLDDFSYEEEGRRYINPQVALDEENAFIQNLRDTQGQRNAQIAQQTNGLGKNVPTNYGGLNGSEAYFNARYQTPQTNSLIGDLRATAQATALNTALNNELEKAKKRYNDAYYAAKDRERTSSNSDSNSTNSNSGDDNNGSGVDVINGTNNDGRIDVDTGKQEHEAGDVYQDSDGKTKRYNSDGTSTTLREITHLEYEMNKLLFDIKRNDGYTFTRGGVTYIYVNNGRQEGGWYAVAGEE